MSACEHSTRPIYSGSRTVPFSLVVIATSRGGLAAASVVLAGLPRDFPAAVVLLQHLAPQPPSILAEILARRVALSVKWVKSGEILRAGTVYVAPAGTHTRVTRKQTVELAEGARVRFCRPSANVLFESVARHYAGKAIGVVLTGAMDDGASGLASIRNSGGATIAQSPESCICAGMPLAAIGRGGVDFVLPLHEIAPALVAMTDTLPANRPVIRARRNARRFWNLNLSRAGMET